VTVVPFNAAERPHLNRRQQAKARTRQKLVETARRLFLAGGYFDTTMRDIARAMGMSTGAIFAQVDTKEALWRLAIGGPAPSTQLAEQVALLEAEHPDWPYLLRKEVAREGAATLIRWVCVLTSPDYNPAVLGKGVIITTRGEAPASAIYAARDGARLARSRAVAQ
jgi:AcrR family transcriptional regulator